MDDAAKVIALLCRWKMSTARAFITALERDGVHVLYQPTTGGLCPRCTAHYATEKTGFCVRCTTQEKLEAQRIADDEEEERLREAAERAEDQRKKARQRMRELFDANPRKKTLAAWIEWLAAEPGRIEAVAEEVRVLMEEEA